MDTVKEINNFKNSLLKKALEIKNEIDLFYDTNKNNTDKIKLLNDFYDNFYEVVYNFSDKYSLTVPKSIINSIYYIRSQFDSLDITIALKSHYKEVFKKIFDTLPNSDDSLEIQN